VQFQGRVDLEIATCVNCYYVRESRGSARAGCLRWRTGRFRLCLRREHTTRPLAPGGLVVGERAVLVEALGLGLGQVMWIL